MRVYYTRLLRAVIWGNFVTPPLTLIAPRTDLDSIMPNGYLKFPFKARRYRCPMFGLCSSANLRGLCNRETR